MVSQDHTSEFALSWEADQLVVKAPTVSVVIPTYNRAHVLGRAIESVLSQDYEDFEALVVDDASSDNTSEMVAQFEDPRLKYLRHETNRGASAARNTGIEASRGRFVAFLDSDDEWLPENLRRRVICLEDSGAGAVFCGFFSHDDESGLLRQGRDELRSGNVYQAMLAGWCPHGASLFMVRREHILAAGMFDPELWAFEDYDLWLRLARICDFGAVDAPLVIKHEGTGLQLTGNSAIRQRALALFMEKWGPVMKEELGAGAAETLRRYHLRSIYRVAVLDDLAQHHRIRAWRNFLRYLQTCRPPYLRGRVNLKQIFGLLLALTAGQATYRRAREWRQEAVQR